MSAKHVIVSIGNFSSQIVILKNVHILLTEHWFPNLSYFLPFTKEDTENTSVLQKAYIILCL